MAGRPKGYADWNAKPESLALVRMIEGVLAEYRQQLPLTARQIFYRLVGAYGYDKTEQAYARLCEALVKARRAQMIPFDSIRDDGTVEWAPVLWHDVGDYWRQVRERFEKVMTRDRLQTQPVRIELWCEAGGMVPQLWRVARPYDVTVFSTGGFSSVTVTHEIAERALEGLKAGKDTVLLHVGDYDPSGESIFEAMTLDAETFLVQEWLWEMGDAEGTEAKVDWLEKYRADLVQPFRPVRVALTEEQVEEHDLPTAPPKRSDSRSRRWVGETCQAEAMPPDLLASTVQAALAGVIDDELHTEQQAIEDRDEEEIERVLKIAEGEQ